MALLQIVFYIVGSDGKRRLEEGEEKRDSEDEFFTLELRYGLQIR